MPSSHPARPPSSSGGQPLLWSGSAFPLSCPVIRLGLTRNRLSGPIPPELGNLSELIWLHMQDNQLIGPVPIELAELLKLRSLQLDDDRLTCIPASVENLPNLHSLYHDSLPWCRG